MSKRFTETEKWRDAWFRKLSPTHKCLWQYLLDNCDPAGVIDVDWELASFQVGETVSLSDMAHFDGRVVALDCGKLWIVGFVAYQYGQLSTECKAHGPAFASIKKHKLDTLSNGYPKGTQRDKEKEKDKEKDKGIHGPEKKPNQIRAEKLHGKRASTPWDKAEQAAWKTAEASVAATTEGEWVALEAFYAAPQKDTFARKSLATTLNNWSGEIQRALQYVATRSKPRQPDPETEPEGWRAWWRETYPPEEFPNAPRYDEGDWWDIPAATRNQIRDGMRKKGRL